MVGAPVPRTAAPEKRRAVARVRVRKADAELPPARIADREPGPKPVRLPPAQPDDGRMVTSTPAPPAAPLSVVPPPEVPRDQPPLPPVEEPDAVRALLDEGLELFERGEVLQARRRFIAAMNGPIPEVLLALARSYDTYYLSRLPRADAPPDMQRALVLYERALERGASEAAGDLERTRTILKIPR